MVTLRKYTHEKAQAAALIQGFWLAHNGYHQTGAEALEDLAAWTAPGHDLYFIDLEGKPVGLLHLGSRGGKADWLEDIFVLPAYQRRGIGAAAIAQAERIVRTYSVSMYLEAAARNEGAIRLYRRLGYDCLNTVTLRKDFPEYEYQVVREERVWDLPFEIRKGKTLEYRKLTPEDLGPHALDDFQRRQEVTHCWRKENGGWVIKPIAFVDDWDPGEREAMAARLRETLDRGGLAAGAFWGAELVGFVSVEAAPLGSRGQYRDLSQLYVSRNVQKQGIGRTLFQMAEDFARERGTEKLYISAHSALESQAFYKAMGCVEAEEYDPEHVRREPCDCQLEKIL